MTCKNCGKYWSYTSIVDGYYFASQTLPIGSYASPNKIHTLGEQILHCPVCPLPVDEAMRSGSDRRTAGDETDPRRPA